MRRAALFMVLLAGCGGIATSARDSWTHRELIAHLKAKGLQFEAKPSIAFGIYGGTSMEFFFASDAGENGTVVLLLKDRQTAREVGGARPDGYVWGRFFFAGKKENLDAIRRALE